MGNVQKHADLWEKRGINVGKLSDKETEGCR